MLVLVSREDAVESLSAHFVRQQTTAAADQKQD